MNYLVYLAHAGHIPHERADAVMTIPPTLLLVTTAAIVGIIVIAALVVQQQKQVKQPADSSSPKHGE